MIEPKVLKGFRDSLPHDESVRRNYMQRLEQACRSFGYVPIDTPVLEYAEVLLGKGGGETDKQVYRFQDHGKREVAMRFDLTVPFARFMAAHQNELYLPFKRYHFAKVYRGENTQKGRYREFWQCDFDTVGSDSVSSDFETLSVIARALELMEAPKFRFHISHRGLFNSLLETLDVADTSVEILRSVDKLRKIGREKTRGELVELAGEEAADKIMEFITASDDNLRTIDHLEQLSGDGPSAERLRNILVLASEVGFSDRIVVDPTITRGLDYYTGLVFETFLLDGPQFGSVSSGGRYDNLAALYTKTALPGVGGSIGLDRLLAAMEDLGHIPQSSPGARVLIVCFDLKDMVHYHRLAHQLRSAGIDTEVFPTKKKLPQQFSYGEKKGIPYAIILGSDELESGNFTIRNLAQRENTHVDSFEALVQVLEG